MGSALTSRGRTVTTDTSTRMPLSASRQASPRRLNTILTPDAGWGGETDAERSRAAWPSSRAVQVSRVSHCSLKQRCVASRLRASLVLARSGLRRRRTRPRTRPRRASASSLFREGDLGTARAGPYSLSAVFGSSQCTVVLDQRVSEQCSVESYCCRRERGRLLCMPMRVVSLAVRAR